jgi:hypothetical protein
MTFHCEVLTYKVAYGDYDEGLTSVARTAEYLYERFRLKRILDCDMLKTIFIEHTGYHNEPAIEAAEGLGQMVVGEFASKAEKQDVAVQYTRQPRRVRSWSPYDY